MLVRWTQSDNLIERSLPNWQSLENISPHLLKAIIIAEDKNFFAQRF